MLQLFDWCVEQGELSTNPWEHLTIREKPEVSPHKVLTDEQVVTLLQTKGQGALERPSFWPAHRHALRGDLRANGQ